MMTNTLIGLKNGPILAHGKSNPLIPLISRQLHLKFCTKVTTTSDREVDFLLIRSYGRRNALARVQSDPLIEGLKALSQSVESVIYSPCDHIMVPKARHLIISYDDDTSILRAFKIKKETNCKVICLGSDIYDLDRYVAISEIADYFVMPTPLHQTILASAVWSKVLTVPEAIDDIALPSATETLPITATDTLGWFGYADSFDKSLRHLFDRAITDSHINQAKIALITSKNRKLHSDIRHIPFDERHFYQQTQPFAHALLSHFAFDCHLNSYVKSPNKLLTSIVRGMVPIASDTPNYRATMTHYNLEALMFANGADLVKQFKRLDAARDRDRFNLAAVGADLQATYCPENVARVFLNGI